MRSNDMDKKKLFDAFDGFSQNLMITLAEIDAMKKQMQANLSNNKVAKGITLNGNINELTPDKVYLTPNSIIAVINANGKLDIKVDGL